MKASAARTPATLRFCAREISRALACSLAALRLPAVRRAVAATAAAADAWSERVSEIKRLCLSQSALIALTTACGYAASGLTRRDALDLIELRFKSDIVDGDGRPLPWLFESVITPKLVVVVDLFERTAGTFDAILNQICATPEERKSIADGKLKIEDIGRQRVLSAISSHL